MKKVIKNIIKWFFIVLIVIITLVAGILMLESLKTKKEKKVAEKNAVSYIEKKYGFTPEIINSYRYYDTQFHFDILISYTKTPTDDYKVAMRHDGKDFKVFIPFAKVTDEGRDDYQTDEIEAAVKAKVASYFDGKVEVINSTGYKNTSFYYCTGDFFDGTNAEQFYQEGADYYIYTVGSNLAAVDLDKMREEIHASSIYVFDFMSEEAFEGIFEKSKLDIVSPEIDSISLDRALPVLDEVAFRKWDSESEYLNLMLKTVDGLLYKSSGDNNVILTETEDIDISKWNLNGSVCWRTSSYAVTSDTKTGIYVPKSLRRADIESIKILYTYVDKEGNRQYKTAHDFSDKEDLFSLFYMYDYELKDLEFVVVGCQ